MLGLIEELPCDQKGREMNSLHIQLMNFEKKNSNNVNFHNDNIQYNKSINFRYK